MTTRVTCPFCSEEVPAGASKQIDHMVAAHPDVVAQRIRAYDPQGAHEFLARTPRPAKLRALAEDLERYERYVGADDLIRAIGVELLALADELLGEGEPRPRKRRRRR